MVGSLDVYRHAHPRVNTALPVGCPCWKLVRACSWSGLRGTSLDIYVGRVFRLQALRNRRRISEQLIEWIRDSSAEACDLGERVGFATRVLQRGRLPRGKIQRHQLIGPLSSVQ